MLLLGLGVCLSGCMQSHDLEPCVGRQPDAARPQAAGQSRPTRRRTIPEPYLRHIVDYHRKEAPGTIVVDPDARYLYYVLPEGKAIRYGVTVGEEALAFSGVAKVGRKEEWPSWTPTADIKKRLGNIPELRRPGPAQSAGRARPLSLRAATRTRCTASTAPTSRNTSARRFPRAASA